MLTGVCVRSVNDLLSLLSGFGGDGTGLYSLSSHPLCACVLGGWAGGRVGVSLTPGRVAVRADGSDVNGDGRVDVNDLLQLLSSFGA